MKSLINALNNIAQSINNLASSIISKNTLTTRPLQKQTTTSNPAAYTTKSNVTITSYEDQMKSSTVRISKKEYEALTEIYNAVTYKGSYPLHHDHVMRELKTKWPTLHKAIDNLVRVRSYTYYENSNVLKYSGKKDIWKYPK